MPLRPAESDRWNRYAIPESNFSASFLGKPVFGSGRIRLLRENVQTDQLRGNANGFDFFLGVFSHPAPRNKSHHEMLIDVEKALSVQGDIKKSESLKVSGNQGREYVQDTDDGRITHGRVFVVGDRMVHIRAVGSTTLVPGTISLEFIKSLQVSDSGATENAVPDFELTAAQQERNRVIMDGVRKLEGLMAEHIHKRCSMNFAPQYLSISAGLDLGNRRFLVHPGKLPVIGVDLIVVNTPRGALIANLAPVYEKATDENSIMAPEGYALAGINVNAGKWIKGLQFIFMKVTPLGFDTSRAKKSEWYGTPTSGIPETIGGDGRPVYGIWQCQKDVCKSIGLIRESN